VAFLFLGSGVAWFAYQLKQQERTVEVLDAAPAAGAVPSAASTKPAEATPHVVPLDLMEVQVGYGLIGLVDGQQGGMLLERIKGLRRQIAFDMGFLVPPIHIRDNLQLRPNEYALLLKGVELVRGEILPGYMLAIDPGTAQKDVVQGIPTKEPAFGLPALWVAESSREQAQMAGYTVVDGGSAIATHLSEVIKRHAHELIGRQEVQALLDELAKSHPKLVEELIPNLLPLGAVVRILSNLLRERVPIRDLRTILESLADHAGNMKDTEMLTEIARQALSRTITRQYLSLEGVLPVIALDPRLDRKLAEQLNGGAQNGYWMLDPTLSQRLLAALRQAAERMAAHGQQPVILCSPALRRHVYRLTERQLQSVPVLSMSEVDSGAKIKAVETVRLDVE
ncbi:MAG TPA: flagellar biosynthesis protein FlhA, partial [Nitrospirales bacterium]|nr:flagellar biosynthesis protein FlhA [Nitrospirales bacterium]